MTRSRIRAAQWCNGSVTLSDAQVAQLARQAADRVKPDLPIHVAPAANDDPYRWGAHGWTVTIDTGRRVQIWIPVDASPDWVRDEITERIRPELVE
jgi:hypothetical protein